MKISFRAASILLSLLIIITCVVVVAILESSNNATIRETKKAGSKGVDQCLAGSKSSINDLTAQMLSRIVKQVSLQLFTVVEAPHRHVTELFDFIMSFDVDYITDPAVLRTIVKRLMFAKLKATVTFGVSNFALRMDATAPKAFATGHQPEPDGDGKWGGITTVNVEGTNSVPSYYCAETFDANGDFYGQSANDIGFGSIIDDAGNIDNTTACRDILDGKQTTGLCVLPEAYIFSSGIQSLLKYQVTQERNVIHNSPALSTVAHVTIFSYVIMTNPKMRNIFNSLGILMVGTRLEQLSSIFSSINSSIPLNSVLYGVERNPWTSEIATLLGTNVGSVLTKNNATVVTATAATIQNFSHPVITTHYTEVMKTAGNYTTLAGEGLQDLVVGGERYFAMIERLAFHEIVWYVSLIVPRVSIMGEIDQVISNIETQFDESNSRVDADSKRAFAVALSAVCGVVLGAILLCTVATTKIISPLLALEKEMTAVANMRLEEVNDSRDPSRLAEIGSMQEAFRIMVLNLVEYRNFMPQSVLCETSDGNDETEKHDASGIMNISGRTSNVDETSTALSGSMSMSMSMSMSTSMVKPEKENTIVNALKQHLDLKKKNVTFVVFNVCDFHTTTRTMSSGDCQVYHSEIIQQLLVAISTFKGMPETFSGDRLLATYNALLQLSTHRNAACSSVCYLFTNLRRVVITQATAMTAGITCGEARVGNMGCQGMKKYTLLSENLTWCYALERFTRCQLSKGCIIDESVQSEAELTHECCLVGGVIFPKLHPSRTLFVYKLESTKTVKEEEWMYQVEDARANSAFVAWNTTIKFALKRDWEAARESLATVPPVQLEDLKNVVDIREWIRRETPGITAMIYH
eukprot:TRINITY_DN5233_c0_g2_i1.p1 TRINITY_DN5233_c0_g2~~TRINITY_DN5233_c0_g2_i1.p1  ORF type:complete len:864 (+),score=180.22 TRINITY_DN5233_c0_g2_i1:45-2636(+)